jgi:hypothetical protein
MISAYKIIKNHKGVALIKMYRQMIIPTSIPKGTVKSGEAQDDRGYVHLTPHIHSDTVKAFSPQQGGTSDTADRFSCQRSASFLKSGLPRRLALLLHEFFLL